MAKTILKGTSAKKATAVKRKSSASGKKTSAVKKTSVTKRKKIISTKKDKKTGVKKKSLTSSKTTGVNLTGKKYVIGRRVYDSDISIQLVLPLGNGWVVKSSNEKNFFAITDSKVEAVSIARNLAKTTHTELIVHGKNGNIEKKESYILK